MDQDIKYQHSRYKNQKPLVEKRRRERINRSLEELKSLVLQSLKRKESDYSRMEKADILEMTVHFLQGFHGNASPPASFLRFAAGFDHCASNVVCFLNQSRDVSAATKIKLLQRLAARTRRAQDFTDFRYRQDLPENVLYNPDAINNPHGHHILMTKEVFDENNVNQTQNVVCPRVDSSTGGKQGVLSDKWVGEKGKTPDTTDQQRTPSPGNQYAYMGSQIHPTYVWRPF